MVQVDAGTCNLACWEAREDVCRCMCHGRNHGIMRRGGNQPGRYCQRKGKQYQLAAILPSWYDARMTASDIVRAAPKISRRYHDHNGKAAVYEYDDDAAAFEQHATGHMLRWPEVRGFLDAGNREAYLVWQRFTFQK